MTDQRADGLQAVGKNALASLRELVAALECDYERLAELREEQETTDAGTGDGGLWASENPDEADKLRDLEAAATGCDAEYPCKSREDAEQRIHEDALSVQVRGEWHKMGSEHDEAVEFEILLCTGGPAVRIMGELSDGEATRAWLEVQDWGTPWTEYYETGVGEVCLAYARCFFAG